jgi:hypothetical protein
MGRVRYVLHPGKIVYKTDGDRRFVGAGQLIDLYGIRATDLVAIDSGYGYRPVERPGDAHLYPLSDGGYYNVHGEGA